MEGSMLSSFVCCDDRMPLRSKYTWSPACFSPGRAGRLTAPPVCVMCTCEPRSTGVGRTYRYTKAKTLFQFGDGLSYSSFSHHATCSSHTEMSCTCTVQTLGCLA